MQKYNELKINEEKACLEYINCGIKSKAYRIAFNCEGMTDKTINEKASRFFKKHNIRARVEELTKKLESDKIANAKEVQELLTKILRGEIKEECVVVESTGDYQSEARIIKKQVTPKDRIKAGELLTKMRGEFNVNLNIEPPLIIDDI